MTQINHNRQNPVYPAQQQRRPQKKRTGCCGCLPIIFILLISGICLAVYLIAPLSSNILILGIDYTEPGSSLGRSDTIILTTIDPFEPYIGMLSIPRDLWVMILGVGENRINTAHYFAEIQEKDSGPRAAIVTIETNFRVNVDNYIRIKFEGFREMVTAMGGVDIELSKPMAGYPPGKYHLKGRKALAFVRHRQNSDDFFRMENGQFMMKQVILQMLNPINWPRLPAVMSTFSNYVDTDIPTWLWPRLIFAILRTGPDGIDSRTINRDMTTPVITEAGANVLIPDWSRINPVIIEMFGQ